MKKAMTYEETFVNVVTRINRYLIMVSVFFLAYFLLKTKVDVFLFLLALSYAAFALLSYKHLVVTNSISMELKRARIALEDISKQTREMHPH